MVNSSSAISTLISTNPTNQSSNTSPKKPSPLGPGSPRASPFRRPESPSTARSPSTSTIRPTTPTTSPSKTPRANTNPLHPPTYSSSPTSSTTAIYSPQPTTANAPTLNPAPSTTTSNTSTPRALHPQAHSADPLNRLNPALLHSMRESFAVLDRDNDGSVTRDDVADMLQQLGLDASAQSLGPYFSSTSTSTGGNGTINLSSYLSTLSAQLSDLSRPDELREAFAAFDVDDSGQVDVAELRDALLNGPLEGEKRMSERDVERVMEGFIGRRAFAEGATGSRGNVFRYADFMAEVQGGGRREGAVDGEGAVEVLA